ncbi:hypothetical protein O3P69_003905 [Scylla paramamosain]|uniref:Uncharacterized protein n=1 Tax=Scylla paramamosain TaxID=85552 RepID=A0AAW0UHN4_SCYPA
MSSVLLRQRDVSGSTVGLHKGEINAGGPSHPQRASSRSVSTAFSPEGAKVIPTTSLASPRCHKRTGLWRRVTSHPAGVHRVRVNLIPLLPVLYGATHVRLMCTVALWPRAGTRLWFRWHSAPFCCGMFLAECWREGTPRRIDAICDVPVRPQWYATDRFTAGFSWVLVFGFAAGGETRDELCCAPSNPRCRVAEGGDVPVHAAGKVLPHTVMCGVVRVWNKWRVPGSVEPRFTSSSLIDFDKGSTRWRSVWSQERTRSLVVGRVLHMGAFQVLKRFHPSSSLMSVLAAARGRQAL